jgi:predicted transcriptional regulator of viral defense system
MPRETAKTPPQEDISRSRDDDRLIAQIARRQHGLVCLDQLARLGMGRTAISIRLRTGRLHQVHAGVYSVGHQLLSRQGQWMAAVLASGPDAVLSHWSAAALWMIRPNSRSAIDVTTAHKSRTWDGIKRHHKALPPDEVTVHEGIPVTSVPRTIFDLAATEDVDTVVSMLRESEHRNLWDRLSLPDLVGRYRGRRGVNRVRLALQRVAEEPLGNKRSRLEERFAPFLSQGRRLLRHPHHLEPAAR